MGLASKVRFVNLKYNDDNRVLPDVTFDLKSTKTLALLQNSGGKTVLTNFLYQPVLFCYDRLAKGGKVYFDINNYFKTNNQPCYILLEISLEDDNGYLLLGVGIKKMSDGTLNKVAFVREYASQSDKYSLDNFPVFDDTKGFKELNGVETLYNRFHKEGKDRDVICYKSTNSQHKKRFRNKLLEYRINESEWKNIYTRVNSTEGGISELFEADKTAQDLLKSWILPAINDKLTPDDESLDTIEDIKSVISEHIDEKRKSVEELQSLGQYREFAEDISSLSKTVEKSEGLQKIVVDAKSNLANVALELSRIQKDLISKEAVLKDDIQTADDRIKELGYMKLSSEIQERGIEINLLTNALSELESEISEAKESENDLELQKKAMECAKIYGEIINCLANIDKFREKLKPLDIKKKELDKRTNDIKFSLKEVYSNRLERLRELTADIECSIKENNGNLERLAAEDKSLSKNLKNCSNRISQSERHIGAFDSAFDKYKKQYTDMTLELDKYSRLLNEEDMVRYQYSLENQKQCVIDLLDSTENLLKENELRERKLTEQSHLNAQRIQAINHRKQNIEDSINTFIESKDKLLSGMGELDFVEYDLYEKEHTLDKIAKAIDVSNSAVEEKLLANDELKKAMKLYKTSKIDIDKGVKKALSDKNIDYIYGLEYIKNYPGTYEQKLELLRANPMIPYSLIVESKDFKFIEEVIYPMFTNNIVPILAKQDLDEIDVLRKNSMIQVGGVSFFAGYNEELIDDDYIETMINRIKQSIAVNDEQIGSERARIGKLISLKEALAAYQYPKNYDESLNKELSELIKERAELEEANVELNNSLIEVSTKKPSLEDECAKCRESVNSLSVKIEKFDDIISSYEGYASNVKQFKEAVDQKQQYENRQIEVKGSISSIKEDIVKRNTENSQIRKDIESLQRDKGEFLSFVGTGEILYFENGATIDAKNLEAQLQECGNSFEYSDITVLEGQIAEYTTKKNMLQVDLDAYGLDKDMYSSLSYSGVAIAEIEKALDEKRQSILELSTKKGAKSNELESTQKLFNKDCKKCVEEFKMEYYTGSIEKQDYTSMIKAESGNLKKFEIELRECKSNLKNAEKYIDKSSNYKTFKINEDANIREVNALNYESTFDEYKRVDDENSRILDKVNSNIDKNLQTLSDKFSIRYNNKDIAKVVNQMMSAKLTTENLDIYQTHISKQILLFEGSEKYIEKQLSTVAGLVTAHAHKLFEELKQVDKNSTLNGKKLFKIVLPKEQHELGVKEYLNEIIESSLRDESKKDKILSSKINNYNILDSLVNLSSVSIKTTKFNAMGKTKEVNYEDTHEGGECSGAQRTVIALIILQAILDYTNDKIINDKRKLSRFIFLDNPFAKITTEDFLELFFSIADKFRMQMFCFTDISKPAVIKQFTNIIAIHIIPRGRREFVEADKNINMEELLKLAAFNDTKKEKSVE